MLGYNSLTMKHIHLFEFEDLPWFPQSIRACMQDHLRFMGDLSAPAYKGFVEKLRPAMERSGQRTILDLCSGSGGPVRTILRLLRTQNFEATAHVTDLFPNVAAYRQLERASGGTIQGCDSPVNATNVPPELSGFRLLANGFHHFRPHDAGLVLADAIKRQHGIAVIEMVSRSPLAFFSVFLAFVAMFVTTPFVRPFRASRLFLTYLLPLAPLCTLWDGLVSCLRVYSPAELRALVAQLGITTYEWDIGEIRFGPGVATYLIGTPRLPSS
jgi:hypothetical protein